MYQKNLGPLNIFRPGGFVTTPPPRPPGLVAAAGHLTFEVFAAINKFVHLNKFVTYLSFPFLDLYYSQIHFYLTSYYDVVIQN